MEDLIELATTSARFTYGDKVRLSFEETPTTYPEDKRWRLVVRARGGGVLAEKYAPTLAESARSFVREGAHRSREALHAHRDIDLKAAILGV